MDQYKILQTEQEKRILAQLNQYNKYNMILNFENNVESPIKFLIIDNDSMMKFFSTIKMILPNRENYYIVCKFENEDGEESEIDETSEEAEGYFSGVFYKHLGYRKALDQNEDEKIFNLEVLARFYPMKKINLQIFSKNLTEENKTHAKNFLDDHVNKNYLKILSYNITYNESCNSFNKVENDILIVFSDDSFIDYVMENETHIDKILFWTESQKAKDLMKKYPKKIIRCHSKFDFLLTPRFFDV